MSRVTIEANNEKYTARLGSGKEKKPIIVGVNGKQHPVEFLGFF